MPARRSRPAVLAEIGAPAAGSRAWSLRRADLASLRRALEQLDGRRVVLVAGEGGGPAVAALGLATAAASAGRRAVVIECDLARPRLAAQVGIAATPGLHEYLCWEAEAREVVQPVVLGGPAADGAADPLVCVCGGRPATEVEALLGLRSFAHMVEKLRGAYDLVLLSAPPPREERAACAAAAQQADAALAALPPAATSRRDARALRAALRRLPVPTLGAIAVADGRAV